MKSRIQPTVPSPPQASTLKSGTSLKKFSLQTDSRSVQNWATTGCSSPYCLRCIKTSFICLFIVVYTFSSHVYYFMPVESNYVHFWKWGTWVVLGFFYFTFSIFRHFTLLTQLHLWVNNAVFTTFYSFGLLVRQRFYIKTKSTVLKIKANLLKSMKLFSSFQ